MKRFWVLLAVLAWVLAAQRGGRRDGTRDWPMFGWDAASGSVFPGPTGITAADVGRLTRRQISLNGTVDSTPIYLHGVAVNGSARDVFFVTTTYGKTIAVDAAEASVLWEYTPAGYAGWAGSAQITNSTPAADADREHLYAASPDGVVQKLAVADGRVVWRTAVTLLPSKEKLTGALKVWGGRVVAVTGGYIGDAAPYQGHVAILNAATGAVEHVWNSLCSDRAGLMQPGSCGQSGSAIWGRAGAAIDAATGHIFVATGNGHWDGVTNWGDAVIELDGEGRMVGNWAPTTYAALDSRDLDLGSTSPVLLGGGLVAQGGKDSLMRVLSTAGMAGSAAHLGQELGVVATPSRGMMFGAAAVWRERGSTWVYAADGGGVAAWTAGAAGLAPVWNHGTGGTSPVVAGGLVWLYDAKSAVHVYDARSGREVGQLGCGGGHWNSPIVVDGRVAVAEGNANSRGVTGVLDVWSVGGR